MSRNNPPLLQFLCLRHGESNYTGIYPDLTTDGLRHIQSVAASVIKPWLDERSVYRDRLRVITSPSPRAMGSAVNAMNYINVHRRVNTVEAIGPMAWRDQGKCEQALRGLSGRGYIDYEKEPVFANAELFETPAEMWERCMQYFARFIMLRGTTKYCVMFSHYEFLCHWTTELFKVEATAETALKTGEHFMLSVYPYGVENVLIIGTFRDKREVAVFDLKDLTLQSPARSI